jgi:hypothetical protein
MTVDLEDRLRHDLPRLADVIDPGSAAVAPASLDPARRSARPGGRRALAVAACALVLTSVATVVALHRAPRYRHDVLTTKLPDTPLAVWHPVAVPPLSPREGSTSVWTGKEWLVLGGRQADMALNDSAAYDPSTDAWRKLAVNPTMHPGAKAIWADDVAVVLAKSGGWTYDPEADEWHDLPAQPADGRGPLFGSGGVWTGHEVVVVGLDVDGGRDVLEARTLDPFERTWGPKVPVTSSSSSIGRITSADAIVGVVWDGRRAQVWTSLGIGAAFDPATDEWSALPDIPGPTNQVWLYSVAGDGHTTYALTYLDPESSNAEQLLRFDGTRWTKVGEPHHRDAGMPDAMVVAGTSIVAFTNQQAPIVIDPTDGSIRETTGRGPAAGTGRTAVWTGEQLLVFGGRDSHYGESKPSPATTDGTLTNEAATLVPG